MPRDARKKLERLRAYFRKLDGAVVAYSGGVDSSVLAKTAHDILGKKAIAVTVKSQTMDASELAAAKKTAKEIGIRHAVLEYRVKEKRFWENAKDRCYYCKKEIAGVLKKFAAENGTMPVVEGTNAEDLLGHRPGYRALKEAGILNPYVELGITKKDIRCIASLLCLPNAEKPSAACLVSRIPYGTKITEELLKKVSRAEKIVRSAGVSQIRVRCFCDVAVIEVCPKDYDRVLAAKKGISQGLRRLGFSRVALDLDGYATGRMD